jgi:hypothetical protein
MLLLFSFLMIQFPAWLLLLFSLTVLTP